MWALELGRGQDLTSACWARCAACQVARESDFAGKFTWRIEHFTRLKDLLKKRKITGLCIKSKRFTIGGRDCRLIVYPRGAWLCM